MKLKSFSARYTTYKAALELLLSELGMANIKPKHCLSFITSSSEVMAAGRADADFFQPKYKEIEHLIRKNGKIKELRGFLSMNKRGKQPSYAEKGLPVVNSQHVRTCKVVLEGNRFAHVEKDKTLLIENGDVLVNGTGIGTIGRCAPYLHFSKAIPDNHVTILRVHDIDPVYLAVYLSSPLGQLQVDKHFHGSSGQIELYPEDIDKFYVWDAPKEVQSKIRKLIETSNSLRDHSEILLKAAKHAISLALEKGEAESVKYLSSKTSNKLVVG